MVVRLLLLPQLVVLAVCEGRRNDTMRDTASVQDTQRVVLQELNVLCRAAQTLSSIHQSKSTDLTS